VTSIVPRGVGYWAGEGANRLALPRPQTLVRPGWCGEDYERIVAYLQNGAVCNGWAGLARCRFADCGALLGSCDLTDGQWLWPQRLEHYVQAHDVCLPEAFVSTMRNNGWRIPPELDADGILTTLEDTGNLPFGDLSYWIPWAAQANGGDRTPSSLPPSG
jgi:hypothetical protein